MTSDKYIIELKIDGFKPDGIPAARLAEYIKEFSNLIGDKKNVKFSSIKAGSTNIALSITDSGRNIQEVKKRIRSKDIINENSYKKINKMLSEDNTFAHANDNDGKLFDFEGKNKIKQPIINPFWESGEIDGRLVKLEGRDKTIHIELLDNNEPITGVHCSIDLSKELRHHYQEYIRVSGKGRWLRDEDGVWIMKEFKAESFERLEDISLISAMEQLRLATRKTSEWAKMDNPIEECKKLRN